MQSIKRISPWRRPSDLLRRGRAQSSPDPPDVPAAGTRPAADDDNDRTKVDALNADLEKVVAVFPDVQPEVFRELLLSFSGESRLYLVTEALLMNKPKVVRGRWRVDRDNEDDADSHAAKELLPHHERFRDEAYKAAVRAAFYEEFKALSHSAIKAVLAEHNYSYTEARPALLQFNSSSWSSTFFNWISRRKTPSASNHPLVSWDESHGSTVKTVSNAELANELDSSLLASARREKLQEQLDSDERKAEELNEAEAEAANATLDCECCFAGSVFERIAVCSDKGHFLCHRCLRHTMSEAIYGQGWSQSVNSEQCTLRCIAPGDDCTGLVPQDLLKRAILSEQSGADTWMRFEDRLINDSLAKSGLDVLKCPACSYAEVKPTPALHSTEMILQRITSHPSLALALFFLTLIAILMAIHLLESFWLFQELAAYAARLLAPLLFIYVLLCGPRKLNKLADKALTYRLPRSLHPLRQSILTLLPANMAPTAPSRSTDDETTTKGRKFTCGARARHVSCLVCKAPWRDPHTCFARHQTSLRAHIEAALTAATKRTCPLCGLSFIKDSGCNKLACPCGYKMCYLCRADVRRAGYSHFCPHFRAAGTGACPEACGRCDLYKDEEVEMERVKADAEREWWLGEGRRRGLEAERGVLERSLAVVAGVGAQPRKRWGLF